MFERFSERARRVLFFARYEASELGSTDIDTEHLLLGLIHECRGLTNRLFADAGIAVDEIRNEVLRRVVVRSTTSTSAEIPFSTAAPSACYSTRRRKPTGCCTITSEPSTCYSGCSVNKAPSPPTS
jgi:ATP-dependent Clp protease ATP-binding subunit ClpA